MTDLSGIESQIRAYAQTRRQFRTCIDVDDLVQEGLAAALEAAGRWDGDGGGGRDAYAFVAAKRAIGALLDTDELGSPLTRSEQRLIRYGRGAAAGAAAEGTTLSVDALLDRVRDAATLRAHERGVDAEAALRRDGTLATLDRPSFRVMLADRAAVRLDSTLGSSTDTTRGDLVAAPADTEPPSPLLDMLSLLDDDARVALEDGSDGRRRAGHASRALAVLSSPHLQWAMLG
jgi:DNA-directed RNA polymerase specialized sigma24 family protein